MLFSVLSHLIYDTASQVSITVNRSDAFCVRSSERAGQNPISLHVLSPRDCATVKFRFLVSNVCFGNFKGARPVGSSGLRHKRAAPSRRQRSKQFFTVPRSGQRDLVPRFRPQKRRVNLWQERSSIARPRATYSTRGTVTVWNFVPRCWLKNANDGQRAVCISVHIAVAASALGNERFVISGP